jgi:hypothetical protein
VLPPSENQRSEAAEECKSKLLLDTLEAPWTLTLWCRKGRASVPEISGILDQTKNFAIFRRIGDRAQ